MSGAWIRPTGWAATINGASFSNTAGKGVVGIKCLLDGNGCLATATIEIAGPDLNLTPFSGTASVALLEGAGVYPLFTGIVVDSKHDGHKTTVIIDGIDILIRDAFWDGQFPPAIPGTTAINLVTGLTVPSTTEWLDKTAASAVQQILEKHPDALWGVNAALENIIAKPSQGSGPAVQANQVFGLARNNYTITPYITDFRGRSKYGAIERAFPRGPLVPRRSASFDIREFDESSETVTYGGAGLVAGYTTTLRVKDLTTEEGIQITTSPISWNNRDTTQKYEFEGQGFAVSLCYDFQNWYDNSLLPRLEAGELLNGSGYEPVSATLSMGIDLKSLGLGGTLIFDPPPGGSGGGRIGGGETDRDADAEKPGVHTSAAMWLSYSSDFSPDAISPPFGKATGSPFIHPERHDQTIVVIKAESQVRRKSEQGTTPVYDFPVPSEYYTQAMAAWMQKVKPGGAGGRWLLWFSAGWYALPPDFGAG
jgi:hypothetical protein